MPFPDWWVCCPHLPVAWYHPQCYKCGGCRPPPSPAALPQVLFYVRLGGDILGRMVPPMWHARQPRTLAAWAALKAALTPLLMVAMLRPALLWGLGGDAALVALVATLWALSGYCNTGGNAYEHAHRKSVHICVI